MVISFCSRTSHFDIEKTAEMKKTLLSVDFYNMYFMILSLLGTAESIFERFNLCKK